MSLRGPVLTRAGEARSAEFDGTDGRVGRGIKVSFKNLHTLCVYR